MAVSRRLRFEILRRDGHACRYCGAMAPDVKLTVDHVIPVTLGGGDDPRNLVTACQECNAGKSSVQPDQPIVEDVDATALLFARAIDKAAQIRREQIGSSDALLDGWLNEWHRWTYTVRESGETYYFDLPNDWRVSVLRFLDLGLSVEDMGRLIDETMGIPTVRDEFRYFCKLCWNETGTRQEMARRLIEDGDI